jgi:hypothetical protein
MPLNNNKWLCLNTWEKCMSMSNSRRPLGNLMPLLIIRFTSN